MVKFTRTEILELVDKITAAMNRDWFSGVQLNKSDVQKLLDIINSETKARKEAQEQLYRERETHAKQVFAQKREIAKLQPLNLSDRAVQKRLAIQWGYVPKEALDEKITECAVWKERTVVAEGYKAGEVWYWQGAGEDHLESLINSLPVVIRADQLRELTRPKLRMTAEQRHTLAANKFSTSWNIRVAEALIEDVEAHYGIK